MKQKNLAILGGGISGLALLWYLKKYQSQAANIFLLEKASRLGGWIQTTTKEGFLFEKGPRSCRVNGNGRATLELIQELGLESQVILGHPSAHFRFLYLQQKLHKLPSSIWGFLNSSLTRRFMYPLLKEWARPKGISEDESVNNFFVRRLGQELTDTFVDPLISGIYAGHTRELSMKACFEKLFQWERQYGSLTKGLWFARHSKGVETTPFIRQMQKASLFSFKHGMQTLTDTLAERLEEHIFKEHEVVRLKFSSDGIDLYLKDGRQFWMDEVYSTLPAHRLSLLMQEHDPQLSKWLDQIPSTSIAIVNLGYKKNVLPHQGFGYLIPTKEKEDILGVVWDSCVFPEQNQSLEETRITVMLGGCHMIDFHSRTQGDFLNLALKALRKHLNLTVEPDVVDVHLAKQAIPQYLVGHPHLKKTIRERMQSLSPHFHLLGSAFDGVSVNDCIANASHFSSRPVIAQSRV